MTTPTLDQLITTALMLYKSRLTVSGEYWDTYNTNKIQAEMAEYGDLLDNAFNCSCGDKWTRGPFCSTCNDNFDAVNALELIKLESWEGQSVEDLMAFNAEMAAAAAFLQKENTTETAAYIAPVAEVQQVTAQIITQADVDAAWDLQAELAEASYEARRAGDVARANELLDASRAQWDTANTLRRERAHQLETIHASAYTPTEARQFGIYYNGQTGLFDGYYHGVVVVTAQGYLPAMHQLNEITSRAAQVATEHTAADPSTLSDEEVLEVVAASTLLVLAELDAATDAPLVVDTLLAEADVAPICSWCADRDDDECAICTPLDTEVMVDGPCPTCNGDGLVVRTVPAGHDIMDRCEQCEGSGQVPTPYPMDPLPFTPTADEQRTALLELEAMAGADECRCGAAIAYRCDQTGEGVCRGCRDGLLYHQRRAAIWTVNYRGYLAELLAA